MILLLFFFLFFQRDGEIADFKVPEPVPGIDGTGECLGIRGRGEGNLVLFPILEQFGVGEEVLATLAVELRLHADDSGRSAGAEGDDIALTGENGAVEVGLNRQTLALVFLAFRPGDFRGEGYDVVGVVLESR